MAGLLFCRNAMRDASAAASDCAGVAGAGIATGRGTMRTGARGATPKKRAPASQRDNPQIASAAPATISKSPQASRAVQLVFPFILAPMCDTGLRQEPEGLNRRADRKPRSAPNRPRRPLPPQH